MYYYLNPVQKQRIFRLTTMWTIAKVFSHTVYDVKIFFKFERSSPFRARVYKPTAEPPRKVNDHSDSLAVTCDQPVEFSVFFILYTRITVTDQ